MWDIFRKTLTLLYLTGSSRMLVRKGRILTDEHTKSDGVREGTLYGAGID